MSGIAALGPRIRAWAIPGKAPRAATQPEVRIYTLRSCDWCIKAKALLRKQGIRFTEVDVTYDLEARAEAITRSGGHRTVPQIFIGDSHVGGYSELADLESQGKLSEMIEKGERV